jgi:hypothetical protein
MTQQTLNIETDRTQYKVVFDNGKPYEEVFYGFENLKRGLKYFYEVNKDNSSYMDSFVYNEQDEDISESQFISEMISEILEESEGDF